MRFSRCYYADFTVFCDAIDTCLDDLSGLLDEELTSLMSLSFQLFPICKS